VQVILALENHYKDNYWTHPEFAQHLAVFRRIVEAIQRHQAISGADRGDATDARKSSGSPSCTGSALFLPARHDVGQE